jgi:hypothetical protein
LVSGAHAAFAEFGGEAVVAMVDSWVMSAEFLAIQSQRREFSARRYGFM